MNRKVSCLSLSLECLPLVQVQPIVLVTEGLLLMCKYRKTWSFEKWNGQNIGNVAC